MKYVYSQPIVFKRKQKEQISLMRIQELSAVGENYQLTFNSLTGWNYGYNEEIQDQGHGLR